MKIYNANGHLLIEKYQKNERGEKGWWREGSDNTAWPKQSGIAQRFQGRRGAAYQENKNPRSQAQETHRRRQEVEVQWKRAQG